MSCLVLGTVQFGLDYGISNSSGQVSFKEVCSILDYAGENGITHLDTARVYGNSEKVLGRYLKDNSWFSVITKIRNIDSGLAPEEVRKVFSTSLEESMNNLGIGQLDTLMLHNADNLKEYPFLLELLDEAKKKGITSKIGVSGYHVGENISFMGNLDAIQYPGNLFDHQLMSVKQNLDVYIRSIFLQGLFFLGEKELSEKHKMAIPYMKKLRSFLDIYDLRVEELAMGFVRKISENARILTGIINLNQLKSNINLYNNAVISDELFSEICLAFKDVPKEVINPALWKKI